MNHQNIDLYLFRHSSPETGEFKICYFLTAMMSQVSARIMGCMPEVTCALNPS